MATSERKASEKGVVTYECSDNGDYFVQYIRHMTFAIYVLLNTLILGVTITSFGKLFSWLVDHKNKNSMSLFCSSSVTATLFNLGSLIVEVYYTNDFMKKEPFKESKTFTDDFFRKDYDEYTTSYVAVRYILTGLIIFVDIITTTIYICTKLHKSDKPRTCIQCIRCSDLCTRTQCIMYSAASCSILWGIHRFSSALIVFAAYIPVLPAASIGTLSFFLLTVFSLVLLFFLLWKSLRYEINYKEKRTYIPEVILTSVKFLLWSQGVILIILLMLWYLAIVFDGTRSAGTGQIILSLLPPVIVAAIGWILKKKQHIFKELCIETPTSKHSQSCSSKLVCIYTHATI